MIELIKNLISKKENFAHEQGETIIEAVTALLLEAAVIDGQIDDVEIEQTKNTVCSFFDISKESANQTIQKLIVDAGNNLEFHGLTKQIRDECNYEERTYILSMLWQIVLADQQIDSLESNLMRRLSGLLFVSDVDSGKAKQDARNRLGLI